MKISIIHPSRGRAEQAYNTMRNWTENMQDWNNFEYIMSVDSSDKAIKDYLTFPLRVSKAIDFNLLGNDNRSAIEAINNAAKIATGDLLIVVSDDFDCPEHWDSKLLTALKDKTDFIVKTQDGIQPTLITLPIMDRVYYERFGYVYHPDYVHMHADEEMTIVGHMLGKVINLDILFPHNHYSIGKSKKDAINVKNDTSWAHGQRTLDRRAKDNFGIPNPVVRREDIVWK